VEGIFMDNHEVIPAFDILLDEIEGIVSDINQQGAQLLSKGKYDEARLLIAKLESMTAIREKVRSMKGEWHDLQIIPAEKKAKNQKSKKKKTINRLKRGLRTKEEDLKVPLLKTLVEMGGSGKVSDVLDRMEKIVSSFLTENDLKPLQSTNELRWRNTTKWARADMVKKGLLSKNSPYGFWAITSYGRECLKEQNVAALRHESDEKETYAASTRPQYNREEKTATLQQIIEVCHEIYENGRSYNESIGFVAKRRGLKSIHTVADKCTRRLGINTSVFKKLIEDKEKLGLFLIQLFPNEKKYIIEQLSLKV